MKFKIGDKVKLVPGQSWSMEFNEGIIMRFQTDSWDGHITYALVKYRGCEKDTSQIGFPFRLDEIELFMEPGQQLLFAFMEED